MSISGQNASSGGGVSGDAGEWPLGRLLSMAARMVEQDWNNWLASRGMTHAGLLALHVLQSGPRTQRELAAACMVEEQTMSRVLDRLERAGHATRARDPADRRRLAVQATPAGLRAYQDAIESDVANTIITRQLTEPEAFRRMLIQLIAGLLTDRGDQVPDSLRVSPLAEVQSSFSPCPGRFAIGRRAGGGEFAPMPRGRRRSHGRRTSLACR